ncbi:adenylyl-sulfate kinase [Pelagibacteraceae bacterium]|nr:adenylyl-sulfate kinase [Pelagibacteraceae bacterium]
MKKLRKKNPKKGILFWVTGLSGSGKTTISKKMQNDIQKIYGPTLLISGDDIREIFDFKDYSAAKRLTLVMKYCKFAKFITNQNVNLIFAVVGMMDKIRNWNKKNITNYLEIYIKSDLKKIIKFKKKKIYHEKGVGDIVGLSIKPEFPRNPDIIVNNNLKTDIKSLAKQLINKIQKKI